MRCPACHSWNVGLNSGPAAVPHTYNCADCNLVWRIVNPDRLPQRPKKRRDYRPTRFCDACIHFVPWNPRSLAAGLCLDDETAALFSPPEDYNACGKGFAMSFKMPDDNDYQGDTGGFYRPGCKEYKKAEKSVDGAT